MLFTDAGAHPLDDPRRHNPLTNTHYPAGMPESLAELRQEFDSEKVYPHKAVPLAGRRLILFVPDSLHPWNEIAKSGNWEARTAIFPFDPYHGIADVKMDNVLRFIFSETAAEGATEWMMLK